MGPRPVDILFAKLSAHISWSVRMAVENHMFVLGSGCWPLPRPELTVVQPFFRAACKTSGHGDRGRDTCRASDTSCGTESAGKHGRPFAPGRLLTLGEDSPARANESRQQGREVGVGKQQERLIGGNGEPRRHKTSLTSAGSTVRKVKSFSATLSHLSVAPLRRYASCVKWRPSVVLRRL
jgi:hypothetical protein